MNRFLCQCFYLLAAWIWAAPLLCSAVPTQSDSQGANAHQAAATAYHSDGEPKNPDDASRLPPYESKPAPGFTGTWLWASGDDRFSLMLREEGNKVTGFHSVTAKQGSIIDTVSGRVMGKEKDDSYALKPYDYKPAPETNPFAQHVVTNASDVRMLGTGSPDTLPSIIGNNIHGAIVVVRFRSGQPGNVSYGHARLTLRDRYLYWQIMDVSGGENAFPRNAVLIRQQSKP